MLPIQEYLRSGKTLQDLENELSVTVYNHPSLPIVGLKYSQFNSPKTHPVVRSCRGTVLEKHSWDAVGLTFRRFFNWGEDLDNAKDFDWSNFSCTTKEDGSLLIVYFYDGAWHINTSGSFGLGECGFSGKNWREVFWETSKIDPLDLNTHYTYIFELCTPFNKVVRSYPWPTVFLLSMFNVESQTEVSTTYADEAAIALGVARPDHHHFESVEDIRSFLDQVSEDDKTFEGLIIRDRHNERYKLKTASYLNIHYFLDNGNLFNPKRLVPIILAGEVSELEVYIPEIKEHAKGVASQLDEAFVELLTLWSQTWRIESQKEFAQAVVGKNRFSGLLFQIRKEHGSDQNEEILRAKWNGSSDLIIKGLF